MGLTKEQLKERAINETIKYILENGTNINKNLIVWNTYPICIQDICTDGAAVLNGKLVYGDFDDKEKTFKSRKPAENAETAYIKETLDDMKATDKSRKKTKKPE